jgi:hypothetical protein
MSQYCWCGENYFTGKESWDVDDEGVAGCDHD